MGAGGAQPPGSQRGQEGGARRPPRLRLVARRVPLPCSRRLRSRDRGRGRPRRGPRASGGARGRRDLAGVSGLGGGGGGAASLVALSGLAQRPGNRAGGTQIEGEILPAPEGVLRIFSRQRQALCLCLTRLKHLLQGGRRGRRRPRTPRAAPHPRSHPPLGRRPALETR